MCRSRRRFSKQLLVTVLVLGIVSSAGAHRRSGYPAAPHYVPSHIVFGHYTRDRQVTPYLRSNGTLAQPSYVPGHYVPDHEVPEHLVTPRPQRSRHRSNVTTHSRLPVLPAPIYQLSPPPSVAVPPNVVAPTPVPVPATPTYQAPPPHGPAVPPYHPAPLPAPQAPAAGESVQVWVNLDDGIYHYPDERWYGRTKHGTYMSERQAIAGGYRSTRNGQ